MAGTAPVGLLAPVPLEHLRDGAELCRERGIVAFGSRAWEVFRDLAAEVGIGAPVFICASHAHINIGQIVSWRAEFVGWVDSVGGAHPDRDWYRPPSMVEGGEDTRRHWYGFWEVTNLRELPEDGRIPIACLRDRRGRQYRRGFVPEDPILLSGTG